MLQARRNVFAVVIAFLLAGLLCSPVAGAAELRPNIVLIMVDDMGFSDLGCYGGEIETPNLDRLAKNGLRFTQFYNCAKCETTRATLMSGRWHPEVGIAKLKDCVTIAEAMKLGGYQTLMTGKWHLSSSPVERGFDHYFGHLSGATNFFVGDETFRLDDQPFAVPQEGFYTTDANTDYAIQFLKGRDQQKPFFLYIAYNAPHYPLQAPKENVLKYRGKYKMGWDQLSRQRYERIKQMGLFPADMPLPARPEDVPAWDTLSPEDQDRQELMMATYAAMIGRVDQNLGRLVAYLQRSGVMENTLLMFLSDNGACPFQRTERETWEKVLPSWDPQSFWTYDKGWAHACNTPFREYKQNQHEGGICTPFIVHWPQKISVPGSTTTQSAHLVDIMATCLDVGGIEYPQQFGGREVGPARGTSMQPIFLGQQRKQPDYFFTFYGKNNALRVGDWKLVNRNFGDWELYNLQQDRNELNDLAGKETARLEAMKQQWDAEAVRMMGPDKGRRLKVQNPNQPKKAQKKRKK